ncbi:phosphoribosyltransferase [Acidocella aminolytica]|jgi:putative phosphoribosyl transferase|uniref:phosphoribosyltransferase n=1 Tax=Acidocella aminolytica TaxID=33998 RepID=UPI00066293BF|nr:phosphoribosyltransferase family protein [Acidocella aminolytica]SHE30815.1 putative phosphoribosyl transferase [Acidocella aminolytica 101 = DSM 11237]
MIYKSRRQAGEDVARHLTALRGQSPVILALPRGGVPVGVEIAKALNAPLGLVLVRKIGVPGNEEFALGAIAEADPPELVLNDELLAAFRVPRSYIEAEKAKALKEIQRRHALYLGSRPPLALEGRLVVLTDDGIATGATVLAALRAVRRQHPARLILAVPLASREALNRLAHEADEVICLHKPEPLGSVGAYYLQFPQLQDQEVIALLETPNEQPP